ncbi:MAG: MFS transporter [Pseudomonadota bacterium]
MTTTTLSEETLDTIPVHTKVFWACGSLGTAFMLNTIAGFALYFMISVLKISPAIAGSILFATKVFDILTDPLVGGWSDRIRAKSGRRRPFLLAGSVVCAVSYVMIFTTPVFDSQTVTISYIVAGLLLYAAGYTLFNIPYMSMPAEMTDAYHERSRIHGFRVVFLSLGGLVGAGVPWVLDQYGQDSARAYAMVGIGGAILIFVFTFMAWVGTASARFTLAPVTRPSILRELSHVFSNKHFIRLLLVKGAQLMGAAATIAAFPFFVTSVLGLTFKVMTPYFLTISAVSVLVTPMLVKLSQRIGKSQTYSLCALMYVVVMGSWILAGDSEALWAICLRGAFLAIAFSGNVVMAMSMLTDIVNYDAKLTDVRREGVFTAFYSFVEKFTFAFGPLVVGVALSLAGFDKTLPEEALQTPAIRQALLLGVSYIPMVAGCVAIGLLAGYKLKEEDVS